MFIRFVVGSDGEHHKALTGVITEARLLSERIELTQAEHDWMVSSFDWFNDHLPVPPFSRADWPGDVVAWFKDDAHDAIRIAWDLVALLEEHGVPVRMLRSADPGRVVNEDDYQVVVEEWNRL
jgi:hypothetical protein